MGRTAVGAVAIALLLAGCGGDEGEPDGPVNLLDRLSPGQAARAVVVDLRAVREKLGAGALDLRTASFDDPAERRYADLYGAAFPLTVLPREAPVLEALDLGRVTATANNGYAGGPDALTVLATDQPFDEVADALAADGYTRDGSVLRKENPEQPTAGLAVSVMAGGDGVIAVGQTADVVPAAAEGTAPGIRGVVRSLVESLSAPAVQAYEFGPTCPKAVAMTDDVDEGRARLVIVTDSPRADRLTADDPDQQAFADMRFEEPAIDADRVTVRFSYPRDTGGRPPLTILPETTVEDLYDCD